MDARSIPSNFTVRRIRFKFIEIHRDFSPDHQADELGLDTFRNHLSEGGEFHNDTRIFTKLSPAHGPPGVREPRQLVANRNWITVSVTPGGGDGVRRLIARGARQNDNSFLQRQFRRHRIV